MEEKKIVIITGKGKSSFELSNLLKLIRENPENVEIICEQQNESHSLTLAKKALAEYKNKFNIRE